MKEYVDIVLTADNNYTKVIGVLMYSILQNLSKDKIARFHIFSYKFTPKDIKELEKLKEKFNCEILNTKMEDYIDIFNFTSEDKFNNKWISIACYFRLLIFNILPDYVEKCFYIDSDMIVDCDLSELKLSDDKLFLACVEPVAMQNRDSVLKHCPKLPEFEKLNNEPDKYPYFNAGLFLVNLKKAKELDIWNQILEILNKYPTLPYCDQDVLNMIFGQKYSDLLQFGSSDYNVFTDINYQQDWNNVPIEKELLLKYFYNPKIYHFAGASKPWSSNKVKNYSNIWWKYCKKTPWIFYFCFKYIYNLKCRKYIPKIKSTYNLIMRFHSF